MSELIKLLHCSIVFRLGGTCVRLSPRVSIVPAFPTIGPTLYLLLNTHTTPPNHPHRCRLQTMFMHSRQRTQTQRSLYRLTSVYVYRLSVMVCPLHEFVISDSTTCPLFFPLLVTMHYAGCYVTCVGAEETLAERQGKFLVSTDSGAHVYESSFPCRVSAMASLNAALPVVMHVACRWISRWRVSLSCWEFAIGCCIVFPVSAPQ